MQGCGPTVPDHPSESYPGARMDGHSGSENDDSADQGDKIPELCDTSDDDCYEPDEPDPRPRFRIPSSQWKSEKHRAIQAPSRCESESAEVEGQGSDDGEMRLSESEGDFEDDEDQVSNSGPQAGSVDMFVRLAEMANQFMDTVKEMRKSTKFPKRDASPPPTKQRKKKLTFTPPRKAPDVVGPTQELDDDDMERDSLSSETSRAPRKRLLAEWRVVDVINKSKLERSEAMVAFSEIAAADLSKSGPSDDFRMSEASLGGFKPAQVMFHALLSNINSHLTNYFCSEICFNGKIANWV